MKRLLALLSVLLSVSLSPLSSQTVLHLRYGAGAKISLCGASNTTPIILQTCTTGPGNTPWFHVNDVVWVWGVDTNWDADGTRIISAVNADNLHYTITYMNGSNTQGKGNFAAASRIGAWVGATLPYTLTGHPRLWFNGPGGSLTTRIMDPDGTGPNTAPRAQPGWAPWDAITSWLDGNINSNYQWNGTNFALFRGGTYGPITSMALRFLGDNTQTVYRDGAIHWIENAERVAESIACDETQSACGDSTDADYAAGYNTLRIAQTYDLMHAYLSPSDISYYTNMMFTDKTDGATCTAMYYPGTGTVTTSVATTGVMTGSGTNWTTSLAPGYVIYPAGYNPWTVVSVDSDTQIHYRTINLAGANFSGKSLTYQIAQPWQSGNCGWSFWAKHQGYSSLSPYGPYPPNGGLSLSDLFANQYLTKTAAFLSAGLSAADDDPRAARMAEGAANWYNDVGFPLYQAYWTGPIQIDSQYGPDRFGEFTAEIVWDLYNATGGAVNYLTGNWLKNRALFNIYEWLPTSSNTAPYGLGYGTSNATTHTPVKTVDPPQFTEILASSSEGQYLNWFMQHVTGFFSSTAFTNIKTGSCLACPAYYAFTDPTFTATDYRSTLPPSKAFIHTDVESTSPTTNTSMVIDRTGFSSSSDTLIHIMAVDIERDTNHLSSTSNGSNDPASYKVYKNAYLIGEDCGDNITTACSSPLGKNITHGYTNWDKASMYMEIGGTNNLKDANGTTVHSDVQVPAYSDGGTGPNFGKYAYTEVDSSGAYTAAANISKLLRHFIDAKDGGRQYLGVYDYVSTTSGMLKRTYVHYPNNGQTNEGNTVYTQGTNSVVSKSSVSDGTQISTVVLFPGAAGFTYQDNPDGTYSGGFGQTSRVSICAGTGTTSAGCDAANTTAEFITLHQISGNQTDVMPTPTLLTATNFRVVQIPDSTSPKIMCFPQAGLLYTALSFTSTFSGTGQHVCAGFAPGVYNVTVNGSAVSGSPFTVASADTVIAWNGASGPTNISQSGAAATLNLSPPSLTFTCTAGGANPASQSVAVSSTGVVLDNWSGSTTQSWLSISPTSGAAAGTFNASANCSGLTAGSYTDTITVASTTSGITNSPQSVNVSLTVNPAVAVTITTPSIPSGTWLTAFSQSLSASGGTGPYTYSVISGSLPTGLTMNSGGTISGVPTVAGSYPVGIVAFDSNSVTSPEHDYTITIAFPFPAISVGGKLSVSGSAH